MTSRRHQPLLAVALLAAALLALSAGARCSDGTPTLPDGRSIVDASDATAPSDARDDAAKAPLLTFGNIEAVKELNSDASEDDPSPRNDLLEIYFERAGNIFRATRAAITDKWSAPRKIAALSSTEADSSPRLSGDGLTIYITSQRTGGTGSQDIYVSTRKSLTSVAWTTPVEVSELNSKGTDCCTTFDKDDLTMIFVSNRGGAGDLFISTRAKVDDPWGKPTALAAINTAVRDTNPWLGPQGRLLMFASDRPGTSGDLDIWIVDLLAAQSDGGVAPLAGTALATPLPLPGINSAYPDQDPWLSPDGKTLYFASSRGGSSDIYRARLIE